MDYIWRFHEFATGGVPSYTTAFYNIKWGTEYCSANCTESGSYSPVDFFNLLQKHAAINVKEDSIAILGLAVVWTMLRYITTLAVLSPIAKYFKLTALNVRKYPESAWKLIVYSILWSYTCYAIFAIPENEHIFYNPDEVWFDFKSGLEIKPVIYYLYMLQLSFYIHSIYGTLFMDAWRKDTIMMLFHHLLTISLIGFSYACRYHKIGVLVLFVHDVTDIALEFTKCNVYFKNRGGQFYKFHDILSTIGFLVFAICWYLFRLYWLPLKVLHSTGYGSMVHHSKKGYIPFYFFFNGMLWILQALNIYWFMFIVNFLIKVATGQMNEVDDIREEEVLEGNAKNKQQTRSNGTRKSPRLRSKKAD